MVGISCKHCGWVHGDYECPTAADRPPVAGQQCGDARQAYDKNGREIMVGDVLKVYHFTAALRRKKHYMYKQVVARAEYSDGTPYLKVSHLDLTDDTYVIFCDDERLPDYEIVDSIKCDHHDRPTAAP